MYVDTAMTYLYRSNTPLCMVNVIRKYAGKKPKLVELSCFVSRCVDIKRIIGKQQQSFSEKVKEVLSGQYI